MTWSTFFIPTTAILQSKLHGGRAIAARVSVAGHSLPAVSYCQVRGRWLNNRVLDVILERQRDYLKGQPGADKPICTPDAVTELIQQLPSLYAVTEEDIARVLCVSRSTLVRHLKSLGTGFRPLLDQERHRRYRMLAEAGANYQDILFQLGYSSYSSLYRARQRWGEI